MTNTVIANTFFDLAKLEKHPFKSKAYYKVATLLQDYTGDDYDSLPGVGEKILKKIHELKTTGKISKLEGLKKSGVTGKKNVNYIPHSDAKSLAEGLFSDFGIQYEICGSIRREKEDVSDIDILVLQKSIPLLQKKLR